MSDEWKDGYQQGFKDGYDLGKRWQQLTVPNPYTDIPKEGWKPKPFCSICGMDFSKPMGYVCPYYHCPSKIT